MLLARWWMNSSAPGQNGHCFTKDIFRCIFMNEKFCVWIKISLKYVPKGLINNNAALVEIMSWCWIDDKPLSETMLKQPSSMTLICSTRGRWVNTLRLRRNGQHFANNIFRRIFFNENVWISIKISLKFVPKGSINNNPALVEIMAWRHLGDKPLSQLMMVFQHIFTSLCLNKLMSNSALWRWRPCLKILVSWSMYKNDPWKDVKYYKYRLSVFTHCIWFGHKMISYNMYATMCILGIKHGY